MSRRPPVGVSAVTYVDPLNIKCCSGIAGGRAEREVPLYHVFSIVLQVKELSLGVSFNSFLFPFSAAYFVLIFSSIFRKHIYLHKQELLT